MNAALYIGATGMTALSQGMNVVSNNIANVSTVGYKQQQIQFCDLMYAPVPAATYGDSQAESWVGMSCKGHGVGVDTIRTCFGEGGFESSNRVTDMRIVGKGFYQLSADDGRLYYTRAGDFNFTSEGYLENPAGLKVMGWPIDEAGVVTQTAQPIQVDLQAVMPSKPSSAITMAMNLGATNNVHEHPDNPYFSMLAGWDATSTRPLDDTQYTYTQNIRLYGADGATQEMQIYIDGAPPISNEDYTYEFLITSLPADRSTARPGDGLHMSGTLTFNKSGQLIDMMAYTPTAAGSQNLADWVPATLSDGAPQMEVNGQIVSLNMGLTQANNSWSDVPATAAAVGKDGTKLGGMTNPVRNDNPSTAYNGSFVTRQIMQDGYPEGHLSSLTVRQDGTVHTEYTNNQYRDYFKIPICNFTSEDGLRREGGNLFSQAPEAGELFMGEAGTSNFGLVQAYTLETSNVDLPREMTSMIITQRGFQANSKVISTADAMLQKAMELKRS